MMVHPGPLPPGQAVTEPSLRPLSWVSQNAAGLGAHPGTAPHSPAFVGSGSGEVMDAPGPKCDRRLELPFSFEVAA
jgi:hypothetical protein